MHSKKSLKQKLKYLDRLLFLTFRAQEKNIMMFIKNNPRAHSARMNSLLFTSCACITFGLADINDWLFGIIAVLAPVSSFMFFKKTSNAAETWQEEFDKKLMAYDPVDLINFKWLQKSTETKGSIDYGTLRDWMYIERSAIKNMLYPRSDEELVVDKKQSDHVQIKLEFIERKI